MVYYFNLFQLTIGFSTKLHHHTYLPKLLEVQNTVRAKTNKYISSYIYNSHLFEATPPWILDSWFPTWNIPKPRSIRHTHAKRNRNAAEQCKQVGLQWAHNISAERSGNFGRIHPPNEVLCSHVKWPTTLDNQIDVYFHIYWNYFLPIHFIISLLVKLPKWATPKSTLT